MQTGVLPVPKIPSARADDNAWVETLYIAALASLQSQCFLALPLGGGCHVNECVDDTHGLLPEGIEYEWATERSVRT